MKLSDQDRCCDQRELTPNSIWRCNLPIGHEGEHHFVRTGWKS